MRTVFTNRPCLKTDSGYSAFIPSVFTPTRCCLIRVQVPRPSDLIPSTGTDISEALAIDEEVNNSNSFPRTSRNDASIGVIGQLRTRPKGFPHRRSVSEFENIFRIISYFKIDSWNFCCDHLPLWHICSKPRCFRKAGQPLGYLIFILDLYRLFPVSPWNSDVRFSV